MLRLAILRHAEALPLAAGGDLARPLSPSGREMAALMGRYFRDTKLQPELALVSPSQRTRETFEQLEQGAGQTFAVDFVPALYNATLETLEAIVTEAAKDIHFLLLVGHNPGFAELAQALAGKGKKGELARMRDHFPTPCLALIDFDGKSWSKALPGRGRLEVFVTRKMLAEGEQAG